MMEVEDYNCGLTECEYTNISHHVRCLFIDTLVLKIAILPAELHIHESLQKTFQQNEFTYLKYFIKT